MVRETYSRVMEMKQLFTGMAAIFTAAVLVFSAGAVAADSAILMDVPTGQVLYARTPHSRHLIASTTKIMTALVICEQCNVLDRVRIPKEAVGIEGSSMYLREGEVLTVQELLYGLMLRSGNDAATALAIYCAGSQSAFVEQMNDKARTLGLQNTHFMNPHGLDHPDHYSTAWDLAVLSAYAMANPIFARTVSAKTAQAGKRSLQNHNKLLWQVPGADGIKTGFTRASGRILVSSAVRNGRRLIAVTINDPCDWQDHRHLLETGFRDLTLTTVILQGQTAGGQEVAGGEAGRVSLIAAENFSYPLRPGEHLRWSLEGPGFVYAPVAEGQKAGFLRLYLGDTCVGKVPLQFGQTIEIEQLRQPTLRDRLLGRNHR